MDSSHACETCGNVYDKPMRIEFDGRAHVFDSFECAIHKLAPICRHCGMKIIGHGVEAGDEMYCCAHCARVSGTSGLIDHVDVRRAAS